VAQRGTREEREARQRLRAYSARQTMHLERISRRRRDNLIAGLAAIAVIALATGAQILYFTSGPGIPVPAPTSTAGLSPSPSPAASGRNTGNVPSPSLAEGRAWTGTLTLNSVPLAIRIDGSAAPQGASAFLSLAKSGFYSGKTCHRLTNGGFFVLQCGSANGDGTGNPGFSFGPVENAPADNVYPAGTIALARQSGNGYSNGSQFFVVYRDTTIPADAAGGYTVIGHVTSGLGQLATAITDAGETSGTGDGPPKVATKITGVTLK
jgi:peptidyl-prolyl cis-trans isomerase B (cyclophilin B)